MVNHLVSEILVAQKPFGSVKMQRPALGDFDLENGKLKSAAQMQFIRKMKLADIVSSLLTGRLWRLASGS